MVAGWRTVAGGPKGSRARETFPLIRTLEIAARSGFICAPETLELDLWFGLLRKHKHFGSLLSAAHAFFEAASLAFATYADSSKFFAKPFSGSV